MTIIDMDSQQEMRQSRLQAIGMGVIAAVLWWLVALVLFKYVPGIIVWYDQINIFRSFSLMSPYGTTGFVSPVWVAILIYPLRWLPLEMVILLQAIIFFVALALVITRFGGNRRALLVTLFSYTSLDAVLQMNIDWLVLVGMLLPVWASAPFLLAKPQLGLGYYLGLKPRSWLQAIPLIAIVGLLTMFLWGWWPETMLSLARETTLERVFNVAPTRYLGFISIAIGLALAVFAFRRQDVPLGILAWLFMTPYIAVYSLPLILGMVAIRWPLLALIFTLASWTILGGITGYLILLG